MQKLFTNELNCSKKNKNKWDQTQILKEFDTLHMQIKTLASHHPAMCCVLVLLHLTLFYLSM